MRTTNCDADALIGPADVTVAAGKRSYTVVAHLDADGELTATPFERTTTTAAAGQAGVARHVAEAPEVEVLVERRQVGKLSNPDQSAPPSCRPRYDVEIQAGGEAVRPHSVDQGRAGRRGQKTIAYAWAPLRRSSDRCADGRGRPLAPHGVPGGESRRGCGGNAVWLLGRAGLRHGRVAVSGRRLATPAPVVRNDRSAVTEAMLRVQPPNPPSPPPLAGLLRGSAPAPTAYLAHPIP